MLHAFVNMALSRGNALFACKLLIFLYLCVLCECRFKGIRSLITVRDRIKSVSNEQWFVQKLDHFNGADSREWKQRFFVNESFYQAGGPVFLMIGGEGPANEKWMRRGTWLTYAKKLGALCLMLEHRFYGKSHPTSDLSTKNLLFLSSRQALADLAHFRVAMASERGLTNSKWVAFGGSYPGSLAAWFRLKYPHLVHAAVATSAPVLATVNFPEYLEVVGRSLASENPQCPLLVEQASDAVLQRLKDPATYRNFTKDFRLCSELAVPSEMDEAFLLESLAESFMDVVQYNEDNRDFEGGVGSNITIGVLCGVMADVSLGSPYQRYVAVAHLLMDTYSIKCLDANYTNNLRDMTNTSWNGPAAGGGRQWMYQTCTEFGFYQSTDSPNQPFSGFPLPYHVKQCEDYYGVSAQTLAMAVAQTNEYYGGYNIHSSRIVFPNGSIDPWHALGVTSDITDDLPAIFIKGTAHCANMYPARSQDLPGLTLARDHISLLLQQWLKQ